MGEKIIFEGRPVILEDYVSCYEGDFWYIEDEGEHFRIPDDIEHGLEILREVKRIRKEREMREANSKGTMLLLRVKLIEYHEKYMKRGSIPTYAYDNFNEMYDAYHALGGNGMVTKMKNEIELLHLQSKEGS